MMKWGRKKHTPSSSSLSSRPPTSSMTSCAFPISWLSKLKQNCGSFETKPRNGKQKGKGKWNLKSESLPLQQQSSCGGEGRFYGGDDDAFWRISFGEDRVKKGEKGGGNINSVWYDSDDKLESQFSGFASNRSNEEARNFSNATSGIRKMRLVSENFEHLGFNTYEGQKEGEEEKLVELRRQADETEDRLTKLEETKGGGEEEEETLEFDLRRHQGLSSLKRCSNLRTNEANVPTEELGLESQKLKDVKIKEIRSRSEEEKKSLPHLNRTLQRKRTKRSSKVRVVYSPRAASKVEFCKIRALEDIKKAKLKTKTKKRAKEGKGKDGTGLESFAIVKCSFDPQKDFRDSMVEMITEKRITRPGKLEELLACYLTLNSDEYHDLIIKVFRQVWFDLNQHASFGSEFLDEQLLSYH